MFGIGTIWNDQGFMNVAGCLTQLQTQILGFPQLNFLKFSKNFGGL
jgi:hypothetical protein